MEFSEELKSFGDVQLLEDGNYLLPYCVTDDYEMICICVSDLGEYVMAFDGGTTIASLRVVYNFKSEEFRSSLTKICEKYGISLKKNVFFKQAVHGKLQFAVDSLAAAIREICRI